MKKSFIDMEIWQNKSLSSLDLETWKDLSDQGFAGYHVSNLGRLKSCKRTCPSKNNKMRVVPERILAQRLNPDGYCSITLKKDGRKRGYGVHRFVATAFIPNPHKKPQVNHKYGNKRDNRWFMLEWTTNAENQKHAFKIGLGRSGDAHANSKLTSDQVLKIFKSTESQTALAEQFGVNSRTISTIKTGVSWSRVTGKEYAKSNRIDEEIAKYILNSTVSAKHLSEELSLPINTVYNVREGRTFKTLQEVINPKF